MGGQSAVLPMLCLLGLGGPPGTAAGVLQGLLDEASFSQETSSDLVPAALEAVGSVLLAGKPSVS